MRRIYKKRLVINYQRQEIEARALHALNTVRGGPTARMLAQSKLQTIDVGELGLLLISRVTHGWSTRWVDREDISALSPIEDTHKWEITGKKTVCANCTRCDAVLLPSGFVVDRHGKRLHATDGCAPAKE